MTLSALTAAAPLRLGASGPAVVELQQALRALGHELAVDGGFGRITCEAVIKFQGAHGLAADGVVGAKTATVIDALLASRKLPLEAAPTPMPSVLAVAPHLATMRAISGTKEVPGPQDNPAILAWRDEIARRYPKMAAYCAEYKHDAIAWCGLAVAYVTAVNDMVPVHGFLWAANWASWGVPLKEPAPGAILVFTRTGGNHVTLYESETATHYYCRGGNQSDMVNVSARSKAQAPFAIRWPSELPLPTTGRKWGATANAATAGKEA